MSNQKKIIVANWKMQLSARQAVGFCTKNISELSALAQQATLIICPSYEALYPCTELAHKMPFWVGAQNCSMHTLGAYTGQVSAASLKELNCSYCIVGHSECRTLLRESNNDIALKVEQLLDQHIQPIICIGETQKEYEAGITFEFLKAQLDPIMHSIASRAPATLFIAYEPVWAIGTGITPPQEYLCTVFEWIYNYCKNYIPDTTSILLYGGSVADNNVLEINSTPHLKGLLLGGASLDFQKFKNIVSLVIE